VDNIEVIEAINLVTYKAVDGGKIPVGEKFREPRKCFAKSDRLHCQTDRVQWVNNHTLIQNLFLCLCSLDQARIWYFLQGSKNRPYLQPCTMCNRAAWKPPWKILIRTLWPPWVWAGAPGPCAGRAHAAGSRTALSVQTWRCKNLKSYLVTVSYHCQWKAGSRSASKTKAGPGCT
jgi:hypothetical protein